MRQIFFLFFSLFFVSQSFGSDTIFTHVFQDEVERRVDFDDSIPILLDSKGVYTVELLMDSSQLLFTRAAVTQAEGLKAPYVIWSKVHLINESTLPRHQFFRFLFLVDSIWVYEIQDGQVVLESLTGGGLKPAEKYLRSLYNNIPFILEAGQSKTFYIKMRYNKNSLQDAASYISIIPGASTIHQQLRRYAWQSFYIGIIFLFCLLSLFMYAIFRERIFIYFALIMFFFAAYFPPGDGIFFTFLPSWFFYPLSYLSLAGIFASFFLFINKYHHVKEQWPGYYRLFLGYTLFMVAVETLFAIKVVLLNSWQSYPLLDYLKIPLILLLTIPAVLLLKKKDRSGRIFLISAGFLFVGSLVFILENQGVLPENKWASYGFQIATIPFSGVLFFGLFEKINTIREEKRRFQELDQLKSLFFANISHEFRTPLTLIMGPVKQVKQKLKDPEDRNLLQVALRNGQRLLQLINQLLDLSKLESGKMELKATEQNFAALLKGIVMSFESYAASKDIRLHFVSQYSNIPLYVDQDKMEKVFYNLLSNAFKFTRDQGEVSVMLTEQQSHVEIMVRDNGIGIADSRLPLIFDRFYQVDSSETREHEGTGIGLALVKELVRLHHGEIQVKSKKGKGTTFTIQLPKGNAHLEAQEIGAQPIISSVKPQPVYSDPLREDQANEITGKNFVIKNNLKERPLVLIIEDNADVRSYIKQNFDVSFQVMEAINGQDGIDKALEHLPDLIISDVMMPKKNGYEVCQFLKTDQRSSHIPIILLTAKAAQEEKMQGLETGADDYLVKPFDTKELEVRVRNLIQLRVQLRQRFSAGHAIEPKTVGSNSVDKAFFEKVCNTVEAHLADEQFGVEILAQGVGMSRGHLNRKLKALTDQSANKFIQTFRLQKAFELLQQKKGNVSEIAFETGFSSTAYFVKCFREKYGKTPGSLLNE